MNIVSTAVYHLWISDVLPTTHGKKKKKVFYITPSTHVQGGAEGGLQLLVWKITQ